MVRIAIAGHPAFEVSEVEALRPGPHYSFETLEAIHQERPDDELFFLIGEDSLNDLPSWRHPERVAALATIVVVNRAGVGPVATASLPNLGPGTNPLRLVTIPTIGIASHDLRRLRAEGRSIRYQVPRGVEAYIDAQGLYRPDS
jgi:nicotinate-nucleotide adenylyltransferase